MMAAQTEAVGILKQLASLRSEGMHSSALELAQLFRKPSNKTVRAGDGLNTVLTYYEAVSLMELTDFEGAKLKLAEVVRNVEHVRRNDTATPTSQTADALVVPESAVSLRTTWAECAQSVGDTASQLQALEPIPEKERSTRAWMLLGQAYEEQRCRLDAAKCYAAVIKRQPLALAAVKALLRVQVQAFDRQAVLADAHKACASSASWLSAWMEAHEALAAQNFSAAVDAFEALARVMPDSAYVHAKLGYAHWRLLHTRAALNAFEKAETLDADVVVHMDAYAQALRVSYMVDALRRLWQRLRKHRNRPETWTTLARVKELSFTSKEQGEEMVLLTDRAIALNENYAEAHIARAFALKTLGRHQDAIQSLQRAIELGEESWGTRGLVHVYLDQGRMPLALEVARAHQEKHPRSATAAALLARVCSKFIGATGKARQAYRYALKLDPLCADAIGELARLDAKDGRHEEAIERLQSAAPCLAQADLDVGLGFAYLHANDHAQAEHYFKRALSACNQNAPARHGLEMLRARSAAPDLQARAGDDSF